MMKFYALNPLLPLLINTIQDLAQDDTRRGP